MARLFGSHDPIQAGEFEIPKGMGGSAILDLLQHGKPVQRLITVTEGMPAIIVSEKLATNPYLAGPTPRSTKARSCRTAMATSAARPALPSLSRMQRAMQKTVEELWPSRSRIARSSRPSRR